MYGGPTKDSDQLLLQSNWSDIASLERSLGLEPADGEPTLLGLTPVVEQGEIIDPHGRHFPRRSLSQSREHNGVTRQSILG